MPVADLAPYARNSRTHTAAQVEQIASSIREWGWTTPVLVDTEGVIIAGHARALAAEKLGLTEIPCMVAEGWTDAQKKAYVIADNKLAENAGWDDDLLRIELAELKDDGFNIALVGFADSELEDIIPAEVFEGLTNEDAIPVGSPVTVVEPGDTWVLGRHRLHCGDATQQSAADALMAGDKADMIWTDPPYNVDVTGGGDAALKIQNDNMGHDQFTEFLNGSFAVMSAVAKPGTPIYVAHAESTSLQFRTAMQENDFLLKQCLIWVKNHFTLGRQDYKWQHEPILYGWKEGGPHPWYGDFDKPTVIDDEELKRKTPDQLLKLVKDLLNERNTTIIREPKPDVNSDHPTMKPVRLVEHMIRNSSKQDDLVFDPFGGSGTTLIACAKLNRRARLMELDPKYADVIISRWQNFTGREAVLEGAEVTFSARQNSKQAA